MKKIISAIFLLTVFFIHVKAERCLVKGKIVDETGKPVTKAEVYYGGGFVDDVDSIVVMYNPDDSGDFAISRTCSDSLFYLFITSLIDRENTVVPIEPPFEMQQGKNKDFPSLAGIKITKRNAEVGSVKIQTVYKRVRINFRNESGAPLLPTADDVIDVHFTLKNEKGKYVTSGGLYKKEAFADSSILMSLPEGNWIIEINLKQGKGKTLHPDKVVQISHKDEDSREVVLKMTKGK